MKWDAKLREGIFVGYDQSVKGYKIWFVLHKISLHHDVVFKNERSYEFSDFVIQVNAQNSRNDINRSIYVENNTINNMADTPNSNIEIDESVNTPNNNIVINELVNDVIDSTREANSNELVDAVDFHPNEFAESPDEQDKRWLY